MPLLRLHLHLRHLLVRLGVRVRASGEPGERGDVPGWVLITGMTVALVMLVWGVASGSLSSLLQNFFGQVTFGGGGSGGEGGG